MTDARYVVFGTAGHVDHGKSTLVHALTGTDPDRLAEEKAREMTIDLGFAFLDLPGLPEPVAIVDVPGHEMFLRNMVAGASGVDAAIFVVAADEGVMPQTVEHLHVLISLRLPAGVIVLTKSDKVAAARVAEVAEEVKGLVAGTFLEGAPVVPVSAVTGDGLPELRRALADLAARAPARSAEGAFRLPIDRVFTIKGAGTVVTGTVVSGSLRTGDSVAVLPAGRTARARNLHVHNQTVPRVFAGQRAAVNVADIGKLDLQRGDVLATPGSLAPTLMVDARVTLGESAPRPLLQRTRLRVHHGTKEVMARLVLLEDDELAPGQTAFAQLRLEEPLAAAAGDPFVLRTYSPMLVIGGGVIVDPHPPKRRRAGGAGEVAERETLAPPEVMMELLDGAGPRGLRFAALQSSLGLSAGDLRAALADLARQGRAVAGRQEVWFSAGAIGEVASSIIAAMGKLHAGEPLRRYVSLSQVSREAAPAPDLKESFRLSLEALAERGQIEVKGDRLRLAGHEPQWTGRFARARETMLNQIAAAGLAAPSPRELALAAGLNEEEGQCALDALTEMEELVLLAPGIYVRPSAIAQSREKVLAYLRQHRQMGIAEARDLLSASRKYLLPFLEQMDRDGLTTRQGDVRALGKRAL
jgi:selenocysteine-specific elongation factor